jgi:hypothetical protein
MRTPRPRPGTQQLSLALDAPKLRGIGPTERNRALSLLARLLLEAAGAATQERADERS